MKRVLMRVALGLAVLVALAILLAVAASFSSGPIGPFPGGPLAGPVVEGADPDWGFVRSVRQVALQVGNRSRTTWVLVHEGRLYVPSSFPESKRWPAEVAADPSVVLRIEDKLYERRAVRVTQPAELGPLTARMGEKYGVEAETSADDTWYFRLDPAPPS